MRIAIRNIKNEAHTICRTNGQKITIAPKKAIILDTDIDAEINYWLNLKKAVLKRCGLAVYITDNEIQYLISTGCIDTPNDKKKKSNGINQVKDNKSMVYEDSSIMDSCASPIARQIAMATMQKESTADNKEETVDNTDSDYREDDDDIKSIAGDSDSKYTEENLLKLSKEDLFNICDNFNIKYRKNNSVKTLVGLITTYLGSDVQ